jgi:heme-degrading monooxygenase HmoA
MKLGASRAVGAAWPDRAGDDGRMVIEHGAINVVPGQEAVFEAAFTEAAEVIAQSPGFQFVRLSRGIERPSAYLLLVGWDSVDDHVIGFRGSDLFGQWRALIGPYFDGDPFVEHYEGDITGL